jgi:hypothetical protein
MITRLRLNAELNSTSRRERRRLNGPQKVKGGQHGELLGRRFGREINTREINELGKA